ncbi:thioredoxin-disulfide reductase [Leifsonia sp. Leaf264]|uniref:thioredoxin-disulfide reductase n=1 Tax=Leifsonia sp. Leaf264 TaxID=1736314 RepID=UPI0006FF0F26|nr:thioredoxin-disulfide reductase [Leifsonia sp. Leaf264]KQO98174.1 thioredoxin reductase [Leifsonia sp. Leaf264]
MHELVIIGSGPAALTAAIYAARAQLNPIVIASTDRIGGDIATTTEVENFPGFPDGVDGPDLTGRMLEQAEKFGAEIVYDDVTSVTLDGPVKKVELAYSEPLEARAVIVATGSAYRKLTIPGEERLTGRGVSWCATCDGFFFKEKALAVIGGGDSAMEEAIFLTKFATKVYVIHRSRTLRASKVMQERAFANPKIEFIWNSQITSINGEDTVTSATLIDSIAGDAETTELTVDGVFIAIGNDPRTHLVHGQLDLTAEGTIAVSGRSSKTNLPGVFAAGDVIDPDYRQAITAAASGTVAALDAERYLARTIS